MHVDQTKQLVEASLFIVTPVHRSLHWIMPFKGEDEEDEDEDFDESFADEDMSASKSTSSRHRSSYRRAPYRPSSVSNYQSVSARMNNISQMGLHRHYPNIEASQDSGISGGQLEIQPEGPTPGANNEDVPTKNESTDRPPHDMDL